MSRPGSRLAARALLTLALLLAVGASASTAQEHSRVAMSGVGTADFDWALETLDGRETSLADFRGEVLVINAWATWCAPCVAELDAFQRLRDSLDDVDVRFLFVSAEDPEHVRQFLRRYGHRDLPAVVEGEPMPDAFGLRALPTTWIVDREGRIVLRHRGAADWDSDQVRALLRALAADPGVGGDRVRAGR